MRKIKSVLAALIATIIGIVFIGIFLQITSGEKGVAVAFISMVFKLVGITGIDDTIWSAIVFIVLALLFCGTLYLSRRQENKLWYIATAIVTIISMIMLFKG